MIPASPDEYHLFYSEKQNEHHENTIRYKLGDDRLVEVSEVKKVSDADIKDLLKEMKKFFTDVQYLGVGTWAESRKKDSWSNLSWFDSIDQHHDQAVQEGTSGRKNFFQNYRGKPNIFSKYNKHDNLNKGKRFYGRSHYQRKN